MSRIMVVEPEAAQGPQRAYFDRVLDEVGYVSGTKRLLLVDPQVGPPAVQLYNYLCLRPESPLSRLQREMLAAVVYGIVGAKPCLSTHCEALRRLTGDADLGPDFAARWPDYPIDGATRSLLRYARRLTEAPDQIGDADIEGLHAAGWDDPAVYEATALVGLFNFIGRLEAASGLPMDTIPADANLPEARPDGRAAAPVS